MKIINQLRARIYSAINSRLCHLSQIPFRNFAKPGFLCIKLTERCNSKCIHCNIWHNTDSSEELSKNDWMRFIENLRAWTGPAHLVITGGEALLRPDALDIVGHACDIGMKVELLSNGIACDDQACEEIVLSGVNRITFSLDGIMPKTHDSIRGVSSNFCRTLAAVDSIDKYRKKYRSTISILLKTVIMRENLREIVAIGDWITSQKKATWRIQPIEQNYSAQDNPDWYKTSNLWVQDLDALKHIIMELIQRKKSGCPLQNSYNELNDIVSYFEFPDKFMRAIQSHNRPGVVCIAPTNFEVSSCGDVRFSFLSQPAGNIKSLHLKNIWDRRYENTQGQI